MTPEQIKKLKKAFELDPTLKEVAILTGIPYNEVMEWLAMEDNLQRSDIWRKQAQLDARRLVVEESKKNPDMALKYLERKVPDEFGKRPETANNFVIGQFNSMADLLNTLDGQQNKIEGVENEQLVSDSQ